MKKQAKPEIKTKRGRPKKNVAPVAVSVQAKKSKKKTPRTPVVEPNTPVVGECISTSTSCSIVGKLKCIFAWLVEKVKKAL